MVYVFMAVIVALMSSATIFFVCRAADPDSRVGRFHHAYGHVFTVVNIVSLVALAVVIVVAERRWAAADRAREASSCQSRCGQQRVMACGWLKTGSGTLVEQPRYSLCATPDGGVEVKVTGQKMMVTGQKRTVR